MRKLKLQVQMTIDGFVGRPDGQLDWMWIPGGRDEAVFIMHMATSLHLIKFIFKQSLRLFSNKL